MHTGVAVISARYLPPLSLSPSHFLYEQPQPPPVNVPVFTTTQFMMGRDASVAKDASLDLELGSTQAELLTLLEKPVCLLDSDTRSNMQALSEACMKTSIKACGEYLKLWPLRDLSR